ncbi:HemK family protein methyltransferase [Candidatus Saccharibacteria bacterium]|nr:HemK family protein methyltransferase [Candidatus Saccharibacteria bacterium]
MSAPLPKAYKDGLQNFYGRDFIVTPDVLIPRPETEQLIDATLNLAGKAYLPGVRPRKRVLPTSPKILDVGTGSGCIAITLKLELPECDVCGVDISKDALKVAQKNAVKHGVNPHLFIISNLLEKVKFTPDLIVANLPYVDETWDWLDKEALGYEPATSLYAENRGLALIFDLIRQASERGVKYLILEADPCQHEEIITFAKQYDYSAKEIRGFILTLCIPRE